MSPLIAIEQIEEFADIRAVPPAAVTATVLAAVRRLHEVKELEPMVREILHDPNETPHGPTEIADIVTSRVTIRGVRRIAAMVLKGRSFARVSSRDVAHQFLKLATIPGLEVAVFLAIGEIQDDAQRDFLEVAINRGWDYLIVDASDCARLLMAYERICPQEGLPFIDGHCPAGHNPSAHVPLHMTAREPVRYQILSHEDISHAGAKRYAAQLLVDRHYTRALVRSIVSLVTANLRQSRYARNDLVREHWGGSPAHVVWLYVGTDVDDARHKNWICRTSWIDPSLDPALRPAPLDGDENIDGIEIGWNPNYESTKVLLESAHADKGVYLAANSEVLGPLRAFGNELIDRLGQGGAGQMFDRDVAEWARARRAKVQELYLRSGELPHAPEDCKRFDEACSSLCAEADSLFMFFVPEAESLWAEPVRRSLLQAAIKRYQEAHDSVAYEERWLH